MSEYQRYEFMTGDRPLTRAQLDAVEALSSHIEASSTHALIDGYDLDDFVTFTRYPDYGILDINFGEMEAPDEWIEYELGSLIAIRDELMEGDQRALYIVWLACQYMMGSDEEEEDEEMLGAAARHSSRGVSSTDDDFVAWVELLSPDRRND